MAQGYCAGAGARAFAGMLAVVAMLGGCSSGSTENEPITSPGPVQAVTSKVALLSSSTGILELPQVASGTRRFTDVRLQLAAGGAFKAVSWRLTDDPVTDRSVEITPATNPGWLSNTGGPATLSIRRLHIDDKVYDDVQILISGTTWRYKTDLREATALTRKDFDANPNLRAHEGHVLPLRAHPDTREQTVPLKLAAQSYRLCADPHEDGADTLTLLDAQGRILASVKAGAPCVNLRLAGGNYQLRHTYGGSGTARTAFLRHTVSESAVAAAGTPAKPRLLQQGAASARPLTDAAHPEYWALTLPRSGEPHFVHLQRWVNSQPGVYPPPATPTTADCGGYLDLGARFGAYNLMFDAVDWVNDTRVYRYQRSLSDGFAFFRVTYSGDTPVAIGLPRYCENLTSTVSYYDFRNPDAAWSNFTLDALANAPNYQNLAPTAISLESAGTGANQYFMKGTHGKYLSIADLFSMTLDGAISDAMNGGNNRLTSVNSNAYPVLAFRPGLRHFPRGVAQTAIENSDLLQGQVALFPTSDCNVSDPTRPVLIVDNIDMTDTALPGFTGSLMLGPLTTVKACRKAGMLNADGTACADGSTPVTLLQRGCVAQNTVGPSGIGSMRVTTSTTTLSMTGSCPNCNLAGIDLSGHDLSKANLSGANLNNANLVRANLTDANLQNASMQGTFLNYANFERANLCQVAMGGARVSDPLVGRSATTATGAHFKNANLRNAVLDGVNFASASIYSTNVASCTPLQNPCDQPTANSCASAQGASINNADFTGAYLAGLDMSKITAAAGPSFDQANLFGASFAGSRFTTDAVSGRRTIFTHAKLQGADFTNATVNSADFSGAYFDPDVTNGCMDAEIVPEVANFAGLLVQQSATSRTCVPGTVQTPICVRAVFKPVATRPTTDASNVCPDGSVGPCNETKLLSPTTAASASLYKFSACKGSDALCPGFRNPPNACW